MPELDLPDVEFLNRLADVLELTGAELARERLRAIADRLSDRPLP